MRAADANIQIVAVGDKVLTDDPMDAGRQWNQTVLRGAGSQIDFLSFHLYHPDRDGWCEDVDENRLHHALCAAPLSAEKAIDRIAQQIAEIAPDRDIGIALDEWNILLPPPENAQSMHQTTFCMRDALYVAGMLNVFLRQCNNLTIANIAQLVNVLPLIVAGEEGAFPTPLYHPFVLYQQMERQVLNTTVRGKYYDIEQMGTIEPLQDVPYVDVVATSNPDHQRLVLSIINRHPTKRTFVNIDLEGFAEMQLAEGWLLRHADLLASNSFDRPDKVKPKRVPMPKKHGSRFKLDLPEGSLSLLTLKTR